MLNNRIEIDPAFCGGRPVFRGTRVTVAGILDFLRAGDLEKDILANFPDLTHQDIDAAWDFAISLAEGHHGVTQLRQAS